ncbi:MAG TPA: MFS transporter [Solirubrobacteraceae bacterium]|nr:MFS transporter [Solirubrobacteraceae bacterium]
MRRSFALVWLYSLLTTLAWASLFPVLPLYVRGPLEGGDVAVGVVMSGAPLVAGMAQPLLGRFADRRGRRLLLIGGPLVFATFVLLFSIADSPAAALAFRTAAGIGDSAFIVGAVTVVNDIAPEGRRGEAYSIFSLSTWAGMGLGPVLADLMLRSVSFDAVWLMCGVLSAAAIATALRLPETRPAAPVERARGALFNRAAALPGLVLIFEIFGFSALLAFTPLYAKELGMHGAGLVLLVNAAVLVAMRVFGRRLPDQLGPRLSATTGIGLSAVGLALPAVVAHPTGLYAGAALFGAGHALSYPALLLLAVTRARKDESSAAVGSLKACEALGQAAGASLLGVVAAVSGYGAVFALAGVVCAAGLLPLRALAAERRPIRV